MHEIHDAHAALAQHAVHNKVIQNRLPNSPVRHTSPQSVHVMILHAHIPFYTIFCRILRGKNLNHTVYRRFGFLAISVKKTKPTLIREDSREKTLRDCLLPIAPFVTLGVFSGSLVSCAGGITLSRLPLVPHFVGYA